MSELAFFDTNVLVYMHDPRAAYKRDVALHLFRRHLYAETLVISTQVVQEFYATVSRKLENIKSGQGAPMISSASRWDIDDRGLPDSPVRALADPGKLVRSDRRGIP